MNVALDIALRVTIICMTTFASFLFAQVFYGGHAFGKIFLRGRGIPQKEFLKIGCLWSIRPGHSLSKNRNLFLLDEILKDSRMSYKQRKAIIDEITINSAYCLINPNSTHDNMEEVSVSTIQTMVPSIMDKAGKYINSNMIDALLSKSIGEVGSQEYRMLFDGGILFTYAKNDLLWLLLSTNIEKEIFWKHFDTLVACREFSQSHSMSMPLNEEDLKEVTSFFKTLLNSPLVESADIDRICYGSVKWLRDIATQDKRCSRENKVAAALLDGAERIKG